MTTQLATRKDFELLDVKLIALESRMELRFQNIDLGLKNLESRLIVKLGILMAALFSIAGVVAAFLS